MAKKRLQSIAGRAIWEKISRGRAGIRWDNVVEKIWKGLGGGDQEDILLSRYRSLAGARQE